jgi:predicted GNAT superfamily acetyltransferase
MEIRVLQTMDEFNRAVDVELIVWGAHERDALPTHIMRANSAAGGATWGAFENGDMIGVAFAQPGIRKGRPILWSHIAGVLPAYQRHNIGFALKHAQREWALEHDIHEIRWTFDPLQAGNAHFNLHRLGATSHTYHVNFYGAMTDSINAGIPSDRLEVIWRLDQPLTEYHSEALPYGLKNENGLPTKCSDVDNPQILVEIPRNLASLDLSTRLAWRLALRETLVAYFTRGYRAVDFWRDEAGPCAYLLKREDE